MAKDQQFHRDNSTKQAKLCEHHDFIHQTLIEGLNMVFHHRQLPVSSEVPKYKQMTEKQNDKCNNRVRYVQVFYIASAVSDSLPPYGS